MLTKEDKITLEALFKKAVSTGKQFTKDKYKQTEKRLYAYSILKRNIKRYRLDIEDIKKEDLRKSKDFILYIKGSSNNEAPTLDELRAAKILSIEQKIARDEKEIAELDAAISEIKSDEYYKIIELKYFLRIRDDEVAKTIHCDKTTVHRNKKRLINALNICLYGAEALQ